MIPLATTMTASKVSTNPWLASLYAGVITAVFAAVFTLLFQAESPVGYIIAYLLIGAGPVLGYQLATGQLINWASLLGGIIGGLVPVLSIILWPILVGALTRGQSIGRLLLGSLLGAVLGVAVFLLLASAMGQDPAWFPFGLTMLFAVWGGACGAAMGAAGRPA
jgi:hypothetical protein